MKKMPFPVTLVICQRCGRYAEYHEALSTGWLIASRVGHPGHMVIRCPQHITAYARAQAGLPQQRRTKRVVNHIERGLYAEYGGDHIAVAGQIDDGDGERYILSFHRGERPAFRTETFSTIDELIAAMRRVEPDLRRWRLVKK